MQIWNFIGQILIKARKPHETLIRPVNELPGSQLYNIFVLKHKFEVMLRGVKGAWLLTSFKLKILYLDLYFCCLINEIRFASLNFVRFIFSTKCITYEDNTLTAFRNHILLTEKIIFKDRKILQIPWKESFAMYSNNFLIFSPWVPRSPR